MALDPSSPNTDTTKALIRSFLHSQGFCHTKIHVTCGKSVRAIGNFQPSISTGRLTHGSVTTLGSDNSIAPHDEFLAYGTCGFVEVEFKDSGKGIKTVILGLTCSHCVDNSKSLHPVMGQGANVWSSDPACFVNEPILVNKALADVLVAVTAGQDPMSVSGRGSEGIP
ncbi:hypothetical protein N7508_003823 [Penicillium antarcticum]|uniref:uncharacterized protein n=1 Tax=Penicillium antarcticum TaxID=416450 RepID=UPI00239B468B|nr:uncharacterized protein N7508_003823 [Penicillium antarcticum]KAJ5312993.1 hypothetical protein N7508_003823 [Penicillium antarcticum]